MDSQEKIVAKIKRSQGQLFSIELVPPQFSSDKVVQLAASVSRSALFVAITWPLNRNPPFAVESSSLRFLECLLGRVRPVPNILFNVTCIGQTKASVKRILDQLMRLGVRNIFIIKGDCGHSSVPNKEGDFKKASQLVSFVRSYSRDYFCIGVAGYPDQDSPSSWQCLSEKISLRSDFIITQVVTSADSFLKFSNKCLQLNIDVPIIPGIMPITSKETLRIIDRLRLAPIPGTSMLMAENGSSDRDTTDMECSQFTVDLISSISSHTKVLHVFTINDAKSLSLVLRYLPHLNTCDSSSQARNVSEIHELEESLSH